MWATGRTDHRALPALVGSHRATGSCHEAGNATRAVGRIRVPMAMLNSATAARYRPPPATARSTPGVLMAACAARPTRICWPARNAAKLAASLTARVTPVNTVALAARSLLRCGTAARLGRIVPVEYSDVMARIASTPIASWPNHTPLRLVKVGSKAALAVALSEL